MAQPAYATIGAGVVNTVFTLVSVTACLWNGHITDFIALGALEGLLLFLAN